MPPDLAAAEAARRHHAAQFAVIRERMGRILGSGDADHLHKFRVAVRRTRSALDQLHRLMPEERVQHFSDEFRWVQNSTGAARDADVFIRRMRDYARVLPKKLAPGLAAIRAEVERRRAAAYEDVRALLDDPRFRALLDEWEEFLASFGPEAYAEDGVLRIDAVAGRTIWKAWKRLRKRGAGVNEHTPVREIHRLRIACKKLRYLLEMFQPMYGDAELLPLIRPLKRLQDDLGDFHDLDVQQAALESIAASVADEDLSAASAARTKLVAELQRRQRRKLSSFASEFEALTGPAPKERARRLFKHAAESVRPT